MSGTVIKLHESGVYCVFLITRKQVHGITIQGVFVSILLNMSRFKISGFASAFYVW